MLLRTTPATRFRSTIEPLRAYRVPSGHSRCTCRSQTPQQPGVSYSDEEKVLDISALLAQVRNESEDFIFTDDNYDEPVWEHEHRIRAKPMTLEELQREPPPLFAPAATSVEQVLSAYSAEAGFRELSVQDLAVALQSEGLVDLLLDVRTAEEFEAGPSLPNAVNIPLNTLSDAVRSGKLDQYMDSHVVVVCASGQRSAQATVRLSKVFDFKNVASVSGGMAAWAAMQQGVGSGLGSAAGGGCGCGSPSGGCGSQQ